MTTPAEQAVELLLHFTPATQAELWRTEFRHPAFAPRGRRTARGKDVGAHNANGTFQWSAAVKVLVAYLLRCAAWGRRHPEGDANEDFPCLQGGPCTPAATLNYAMSKRTEWICDMFGTDVQGRPYLHDLIRRSNADLKRKGEPVILRLESRELPPGRIGSILGTEKLSEPERMETLAGLIEGAILQQAQANPGAVLIIRGTVPDWTDQQREGLLLQLEALGIQNCTIARVESGSVRVVLELPPADAERLFWAVHAGQLDHLGVVGIEFGPASAKPALATTTCPSCLLTFAPAEAKPIVHEDHPEAGEPTWAAVACPHCHWPLPDALLHAPGLFVSVLGSPGSGKTFYLASLAQQMRQRFSEQLGMLVGDVIPEYALPLQAHLTGPIKPDLPSQTRLSLFTLRPGAQVTPGTEPSERILCLYDSPGETFLAGSDSPDAASRQLARSQVLLFLFDPTQDPRFRAVVEQNTGNTLPYSSLARQEVVLLDAAARVRRTLGLAPANRHEATLIVVLSKYDRWLGVFDVAGDDPWDIKDGKRGLDLDLVKARSAALRQLLMQVCPEVVTSAESFARDVYYWPVSAVGGTPSSENDPAQLIRVSPYGVLTPLALGLAHLAPDLMPLVEGGRGVRAGQPLPKHDPKTTGPEWW